MVNTRKLKAKILLEGYTQASLAKAANMSKNTVNAKVNGRMDMTLADVDVFCELLNIKTPEEKVDIFLA